MGEKEVVDLSNKIIGNIKIRGTNHFGDTTSFFLYDEKGSYGFNESDFVGFGNLIKKLESIKEIGELLSTEFLEDELLNWSVEVFKNKATAIPFYDYLSLLIDREVRPFTFYFLVLDSEIESFFKIGMLTLLYFSKGILIINLKD